MIYKIKEYKDKLIEKAYKDGMKEFNKFFGINWIYNTPNICVLNNRKEIDLFQYKSSKWVIGFASGNAVYILDNKNMEKESEHKKHSKKKYSELVKHEICHLFYKIVSKMDNNKPRWLFEGVSIYLSGQLESKKIPNSFSTFIDSYEKDIKFGPYTEGGMAVKLLIQNFGKQKLLKLISNLRKTDNKKEFSRLFKKIYGFDLSYKNFNNLLNKK
jgi:hypothetical protein